MNQSFSQRIPDRQSSRRRESSEAARDDDVINISALLGSMWRGKWIILSLMFAAILVGGYYAYRVATPLFQSTAVVMLESRREQVVNIDSVIGDLGRDNAVLNTEVEVLTSRSLLGKVVKELNLTEDPEFNASLRELTGYERLRRKVRGFVLNLLEPHPAGGATAALTEEQQAAQQAATQADREARILSNTISSLDRALTVSNKAQSLVFEVTAVSENAKKSALIADTLVRLYIENQLDVKFEATEQATSWLTDRVSELQSELELAEARVKEFNSSTDLISAETLAGMERQVKDIRDRIQVSTSTREALVQRLSAMQGATTPAEKAAASGDGQLEAMLPRIADPAIATAFDTRYAQQLARATMELQRADNQLSALKTSEGELTAQTERQGADLIQLQQLTREAEASRLLYEYFLQRLKETSAQQGIQQADSRVLSDAVVPGGPSEPRRSFIIAASGFIGALIGAILVLLQESRKHAFRTAQELEQETGYPVMGQIPLLPSRRRRDAIAYLKSRPTSGPAEAIRNLRTSALLSNVDHQPQVILTSSSLPGEGKTTVALALAQNLAMMGKKVLLVEGDIRRRVFGQYIKAPASQKGLIALLTGDAQLGDVVLPDETVGCDVLIAEKTSANAADIFSSERFAELMKTLRAEYDQIIIDTPPVLIVPDARIIAQHADATIFVVHWDQTQKSQVGDALQMFESVNQPVSGLALNQINPRGMKRYGYYQYSSYARYGKRYYTN